MASLPNTRFIYVEFHETNRFLIRFTFLLSSPLLNPSPSLPTPWSAESFKELQMSWFLVQRFMLYSSPRAEEASGTSFRDVLGLRETKPPTA